MSELASRPPFLREDPTGQATAEADVIDRGWVNHDQDGRLCLTLCGQTAHQQTQNQAQQTRGLMLHGIRAGDYATVINVLTRMAANLETSTA